VEPVRGAGLAPQPSFFDSLVAHEVVHEVAHGVAHGVAQTVGQVVASRSICGQHSVPLPLGRDSCLGRLFFQEALVEHLVEGF